MYEQVCIHVHGCTLYLFFFTCNLSCTYSDIVFFRCLEYMDHLITLLEEHPEVELHDTLKDGEENYSVSHNQDTCTYALSLFPLSLSLSRSPSLLTSLTRSMEASLCLWRGWMRSLLKSSRLPTLTPLILLPSMICNVFILYNEKKKQKTHR